MPDTQLDTSLKQYLIDEFVEDYQQGQMSRRDALRRLTGLVGAAGAAALIAACAPPAQPTPISTALPPAPTLTSPTTLPATTVAANSTIATQATVTVASPQAVGTVPANDPAVQGGDITFPSQGTTVMAYLARPSDNGTFPAILVCHENRGLTEHIKDVSRRLAKAGYVALAVDLLSREGGSAKVGEADAPGKLGNYPPAQMVGDFQAGLEYLKTQPFVAKAQYGMVGFCFGGGITWRCATAIPELKAAVPYYGPNPPLEDVPKIQAAVYGQYGALDSRIDAGIPAIKAAMDQNKKTFQYMIYPGANHAFNNDTGASYNAEAAKQAWAKTLEWFAEYVKS